MIEWRRRLPAAGIVAGTLILAACGGRPSAVAPPGQAAVSQFGSEAAATATVAPPTRTAIPAAPTPTVAPSAPPTPPAPTAAGPAAVGAPQVILAAPGTGSPAGPAGRPPSPAGPASAAPAGPAGASPAQQPPPPVSVVESVPTSLPLAAPASQPTSVPQIVIQPPIAVVATPTTAASAPPAPAVAPGQPAAVAAPSPAAIRAPAAQVQVPGRSTSGPIPRQIQIPDIGVSAVMVPVGLEPSGIMASPNGPDVVGWYAGSPRPGQPGNLLIDGHRDWYEGPRPAVFWSLDQVVPGRGRIVIWSDSQGFVYQVTENFGLARDDPRGLTAMAPTTDSTITLITCEGTFFAAEREYDYRRVVKARLVETVPRS